MVQGNTEETLSQKNQGRNGVPAQQLEQVMLFRKAVSSVPSTHG